MTHKEHYELAVSSVQIFEPAFGRHVAKIEQGDDATLAVVSIDGETNTIASWRELSALVEKAIELVTDTEMRCRNTP